MKRPSAAQVCVVTIVLFCCGFLLGVSTQDDAEEATVLLLNEDAVVKAPDNVVAQEAVAQEEAAVAQEEAAPACPQRACELLSDGQPVEAYAILTEHPDAFLHDDVLIGKGTSHSAFLGHTCCGTQFVAKRRMKYLPELEDALRQPCELLQFLEPVWRETHGAVSTYFGFGTTATSAACYQSLVLGRSWHTLNSDVLSARVPDEESRLAVARHLLWSGFRVVRSLRQADVVHADLHLDNLRVDGGWEKLRVTLLDFNGGHRDVAGCDAKAANLSATWNDPSSAEVKEGALKLLRASGLGKAKGVEYLQFWQGPCYSDRDEIAIAMMSALCPDYRRLHVKYRMANRHGGCTLEYLRDAKPDSLLRVLGDVTTADFPSRLRDFDVIKARLDAATSIA